MSTYTFQSSGNLSADRRYDYAKALADAGNFAAAADLYAQMLELVPDWPAGWFAYGEMLEKLGHAEKAREAFAKVLELMPDDPFGAVLHLHRLGAANVESQRYVASLFDQYAPRFESHLVSALRYRGPELLRVALNKVAGAKRHFPHFIDLGCGTGLMAEALNGRYDDAFGVDLSPKMVGVAQKTGHYRTVFAGEMTDFLQKVPAHSADLVLAADVFVYCGALEPVFAATRQVLRPSGFFGFTVQDFAGPGYMLGEDYRFAHSADYIRKTAEAAGFSVRLLHSASARQDRGQDVPGLIALLAPC
jgi:predicted TPR repeat methyltransferase